MQPTMQPTLEDPADAPHSAPTASIDATTSSTLVRTVVDEQTPVVLLARTQPPGSTLYLEAKEPSTDAGEEDGKEDGAREYSLWRDKPGGAAATPRQ